MEHEVGRGPSCVTLRIRTLFEDEEPRRNVEQKNGMRRLTSRDSGCPDESGLMERETCRMTGAIVGPELGHWGHRRRAGGRPHRRSQQKVATHQSLDGAVREGVVPGDAGGADWAAC